MTTPTLDEWLVHSAIAGGAVLLAGCAFSSCVRQPARRQRVVEGAILAAAVVALACAWPSWISVPLVLPAALAPHRAVERQAISSGLPAASALTPSGTELPPSQLEPGLSDAVVEDWEAQMQEMAWGDPPADSAPMPSTEAAVPRHPHRKPTRAGAAGPGAPLFRLLPIGYLAGAGYFLCRWLLGCVATARIRWSGRAPTPRVARIFEAAPYRSRARLLVSPRVRVPVSFGLVLPTVVLPTELDEKGSPEELAWVFAHELTHLERHDSWSGALLSLGQAIYFYLPWLWWLRRQARLCQEFVADAAAVRAADCRPDYAQFLLALARPPAVPAGAIGVLGSSSDLYRRIRMILNDQQRIETWCPGWWSAAVVAACLAVGVLAGGIGLRAEAPAHGVAGTVARAADEDKDDARTDAPARARSKKTDQRPADRQAVIDALRRAIEILQREDRAEAPPQERPEVLRQHLRALEALRQAEAGMHGLDGLGKERVLSFAFAGARPGSGRLGIMLEPVGATLADQLDLPKGEGMVVQDVAPDSAAARAGIKAHDILMEIDGKTVSSDAEAIRKVVKDLKTDSKVEITVLRKGRKLSLSLTVPAAKDTASQLQGLLPRPDGGPLMRRDGVLGDRLAPRVSFSSAGGGRGVMVSMFRQDDRFTGRHQEGSLIITVTGKIEDGKVHVGQITVQDESSKHRYSSLEKVPEEYRDKAKSLVESAERNATKVDVQTEHK